MSNLPLALLALAGATADPGPAPTPRSWDRAGPVAVERDANGARRAQDELLVGFDPARGWRELEPHLRAHGARVIGVVAGLGVMRVVLPAGTDEDRAARRLAELAGVRYAEPNGVGAPGHVAPPNDPGFAEQWHLDNTGQIGGTPGADVEALDAWQLSTGSATVVLAVIDTGISFVQPDFAGRLLPGWDFVDEDPDPTAVHVHGIQITAIAAANHGNAFGVAGVDPSCAILPVRVADASGTTFDLVQGLDYAAQLGADVISMSLVNFPASASLEQALQRARDAGAVLVACAGNGGFGDADLSWPGASPLTISVGATNPLDRRAVFSGTGSRLDLVAPGDAVLTLLDPTSGLTGHVSGCSAATPVVAGIASLLRAAVQALPHDAVLELLRLGAEDQVGGPTDPPGWDERYGWGRVNARRTLALTRPCSAPLYYGTGGPASLATIGPPRASFGSFQVLAWSAPPGAVGTLFAGSGRTSLPFAGGVLLVAPPLVRHATQVVDTSTLASFPVRVTESMVGVTRNYQFLHRDPTTGSVALSPGLEVTFCE